MMNRAGHGPKNVEAARRYIDSFGLGAVRTHSGGFCQQKLA